MKPMLPIDQNRVIGSDLQRQMSDTRSTDTQDLDNPDNFPLGSKRVRPSDIADYLE